MRKVFLDALPRWKYGRNKGCINWQESVGHTVKFAYDEVTDEIKIIQCIGTKTSRRLIIKYKSLEAAIKPENFIIAKLQGVINNITVKAPWMIPYFIGGYNEAKLYRVQSHEFVYFKCPICGEKSKNKIVIKSLYTQGYTCLNCTDGISYPEKFIYNFLEQLNCKFTYQLSKRNYDWCELYKYDFYIQSLNCIIETHGEQHYRETGLRRSLKEEQNNDEIKEKLAIKHGIKNYIILDCRKSELDWIKASIINSKLPKLFGFTDEMIDWNQCHEFALNNLVKTICEYKSLHPSSTSNQIGDKFQLSQTAIIRYLKAGNILGWCNYNPKYETIMNTINSRKKVAVYKDGSKLREYESAAKVAKDSIKDFGVKFYQGNISSICRRDSDRKTHKGFTFEYIE